MLDFRGLSSFLNPSHAMENFISQELDRRWSKIPTYKPSIVPALEKSPWPVSSQSLSAALAKWQPDARQASRPSVPQLAPFQARLLYQFRFVMTAEICGDWPQFGGLGPQLNRLSIVLHLETVGSMAISLSYGRLVKAYLSEKSRAREEHSQPAPVAAPAGNEFAKILPIEHPLFPQQAIRENPRNVAAPKREHKPAKHPKISRKTKLKYRNPHGNPSGNGQLPGIIPPPRRPFSSQERSAPQKTSNENDANPKKFKKR